MIEEPLFDPVEPVGCPQACHKCGRITEGCDDELRVRGWLVYDGVSMASRPLYVRVCPTCQQPSETASRPAAPQQDRLL